MTRRGAAPLLQAIAMARIAMALAVAAPAPAMAEVFRFAAPPGPAELQEMVVYSTLDERIAAPLVQAFQAANPGIAVIYEDLLAGEVAARVRAETDAGQATADVTFSSAMDVQMKLANDGYARAVHLPDYADWPRWANWRDMAWAVTNEPGVLVYHRPSFPHGPPDSRLRLMDWLQAQQAHTPQGQGVIGTYDIEASAVGYLYLARDQEHFPDVWALVAAMARAGLQVFPTSQDILDRVADGRLMLGYNILGSYAAEQVRQRPDDLGMVLLKDYTVVAARVALVPRQAARPDLGARFLEFLLSPEGQGILAERLRLPPVSPDVTESHSMRAMETALGAQLRPVPVSPGLLVYLDQAKRRMFLQKWQDSLSGAQLPRPATRRPQMSGG